MEYRRLGRSGLVVSALGLGCNNFGRVLDREASAEVITAAFDAGITLFDTADIYDESEVFLGAALRGHRDEVVLATKFGMRLPDEPAWEARGSRRYIRRAVERSLRRLATDHIDLYQLHEPDPQTPVSETLSALAELMAEGKVRYVGCSNLAAWQVADAAWTAREQGVAGFISAQNQYSLLERGVEDELIPACERFGLGILPYYPLANGLLTGKARRGQTPPPGSRLAGRRSDWLTDDRFDTVEELERLAQSWAVPLLSVAVGGLSAQPAVASVIAGATSAAQVTANAGAIEWRPSHEQLTAIDAATRR